MNTTVKEITKATAAVIGIIAARLLGFAALYIFIWACYYAGFRM